MIARTSHSMPKSERSFSRKTALKFVIVGILLTISFVVAFFGVLLYIDMNGGVDVFLALAPFLVLSCLLPYALVLSIYVGTFMAAFSESKGKLYWLWGFFGFAITVGLMYIFFVYIAPPFIVLAPVLSTLLTTILIQATNRNAKESGVDNN
ncbi:MAG TPA: hypothetical protein PKH47_07445 [Anaerolineales bacterium]|nr:hypothetical protein [Anaerolineales bacterium]